MSKIGTTWRFSLCFGVITSAVVFIRRQMLCRAGTVRVTRSGDAADQTDKKTAAPGQTESSADRYDNILEESGRSAEPTASPRHCSRLHPRLRTANQHQIVALPQDTLRDAIREKHAPIPIDDQHPIARPP